MIRKETGRRPCDVPLVHLGLLGAIRSGREGAARRGCCKSITAIQAPGHGGL